jgi:hypothetical protein
MKATTRSRIREMLVLGKNPNDFRPLLVSTLNLAALLSPAHGAKPEAPDAAVPNANAHRP